MKSEPSTSHETNNSEIPVLERWTKDLHSIQAFRHSSIHHTSC